MLGGTAAALVACLLAYRWLDVDSSGAIEALAPSRLAPRASARVYWVGHSLMEFKHPTEDENVRRVVDLVGDFAESRGESYSLFVHSSAGAPISLNWRGRGLTVPMENAALAPQRREFAAHADAYDTLVVTESIPISYSMQHEGSAYYLRQWYCAALLRNPNIVVYLYENWKHYQGTDPNVGRPQRWNWLSELRADRPRWESIADDAARGGTRTPMLRITVESLLSPPERVRCENHQEIPLIPVGTVFARLAERLESPAEGDHWELDDGQPLRLHMLFRNAFTEWPEGWPVPESQADSIDVESVLAHLPRARPGEDIDDVHPSALGRYLAGLVSYSVLYRRSPVGLPTANSVPPALASSLQRLVWEVVANDPRTGVAPE